MPARKVRRELLENQSIELLKTLHLVTRDGQLNADARRKLKQVNHLVGLLQPALDDVFERAPQPLVVDVGSGSSYLGFVLYELFLKEKGELLSVESRPELTTKAKERAGVLHFERMKFETAHIDGAINIPLDQVDAHLRRIVTDAGGTLVLVCQSGGRAQQAASKLASAGLHDIVVMTGGMTAWVAAGGPVESTGVARWALERQVRLVAGSLVFFSVVVSLWIDRKSVG